MTPMPVEKKRGQSRRSIDHTIALERLAHTINDKSILLIIEQIIDTYHKTQGKGLPFIQHKSDNCPNEIWRGPNHCHSSWDPVN